MAGFSVNVVSLQAMQANMQRRVDDVSAIRQHLAKIDPSAFSGILLGLVHGKFVAVLNAQTSGAVTAQLAAQNAANQLQFSRQYYVDTDTLDAARFDTMLPTTMVSVLPELAEPSDTYAGAYQDVNDPLGRLTEPPDYQEEMSWKPSLESDLGNVPSFLRGVIKTVIGVDPLQSAEEFAAGDWAEVRRIADRFNNVAWAYYDSCDDINAAQNDSTNDWVGNAGDSMRNYLTQLATGFYGEYQKNEWLATHLTSFAEGVFEAVNVFTDALSDWINARLLPALASIGIAGVSAEIPVVDFLTAGTAGFNAFEAIQAGLEVYDKANKVKTLIDDFAALLDVSEDGTVTFPDDPAPMPANSDTYVTPVGDGS